MILKRGPIPMTGILLNGGVSYPSSVGGPSSNYYTSGSAASSSSSPYHLSPQPRTVSLASSSASSSSSTDDVLASSMDSGKWGASKKIRFAPLPDPRREVLVDEEGQELPLPEGVIDPSPYSLVETAIYGTEGQTTTSNKGPSSPGSPNKFAGSKAHFPLVPLLSSAGASSSTLGLSVDGSDNGQHSEGTITSTPTFSNSADTSSVSADDASDSGFTIVSTPTGQGTPTPTTTSRRGSNASDATQQRKWSSTKGLLRPLLKLPKSKSGDGSRGFSGVTTEEILTLGTINLFRSGSRESVSSTQSEGAALTRQLSGVSIQSTNSTKSKKRSQGGFRGGYSLRPITSELGTASTTRQYRHPLSSSSKPTSPLSKSSNGARPNGMKGTRLLNGRVYGAKSGSASGRLGGLDKNSNLFKTARDEEPEFVEWGYGGMGSKIGGAASTDSRGKRAKELQTGRASAGGSGVQAHSSSKAHVGTSGADDDFDGSGLAWVRRRKEQREREKREKEEKEALQPEGVGGGAEAAGEKMTEGATAEMAEEKTANKDGTVQETQEAPIPPRIEVHAPSPTRESAPISSPPPAPKVDEEKENIPPSAAGIRSSTTSPIDSGEMTPVSSKKGSDHVFTAINVPAPHWHDTHHPGHGHHTHSHSQHHSRSHSLHLHLKDGADVENGMPNMGSRSSSFQAVPNTIPEVVAEKPGSPLASAAVVDVEHADSAEKEKGQVVMLENAPESPKTPSSASGSDFDEDEEDEEIKDDEEDREEDDEDELDELDEEVRTLLFQQGEDRG